ncbi:MAG TPA: phosphoribosylformylglycinamidine cyclo-ligase [Thermoplasmata archaeon]|nr:phosphoribosylformylglycinamidine cyclo-ligase [Thermoplasmata archaeon]
MGASPSESAWTYARSGVDAEGRAQSLREFLAAARTPPRAGFGRPLPLSGHYAGVVHTGAQLIAATTDTVGTKTLLAEELNRWEEVGEDLVAINVNDLAAVGARPIGIVDTISCASPSSTVFRALGRGVRRGLRAAGCSLLGGETALVPELLRGTDLGATALGAFPPGRRPITGSSIRPGDAILGISASGFHANGFTLIRRLLRARGVDLSRPREGALVPVGRELLTPTRTYVRAVEAIAKVPGVHGLAHISGGGVRNLPRLNPKVEFALHRFPEPPALFDWLARLGPVATREMFQTFNMGIGFVVVVGPRSVATVQRRLASAGVRGVHPIGEVRRGRGVTLPQLDLRYEGYA